MLEKPITWSGLNWNMQPRSPHYHADGYCIWTKTVDGMWMPDFTTETHKRPGQIGDRSFDQFPGGNMVVLSGTVRGKDMPSLRVGQQAMYQAWWEGLGPYATHFRFTLAGGPQLYLMARLGQKPDMPEEIGSDQPIRTWTFAVKADDPTVRTEVDNQPYYDWQVLTAP